MEILRTCKKSLKDSLKPKRLLPFFFLYLSFFSISSLFFFQIISVIPNLLTLNFTQENLNLILINSLILLTLFLILFILNCWFSGALVYDVWREEGFKSGLKFSRKSLSQIISLSFVLAFINLFLSFFGLLSSALTFLVNFIFFFSLPSIIIKREDFIEATKRSYETISKSSLSSFLFYLLIYTTYHSILFFSFFPIIFSIFPLLSRITYFYQVFSYYGEFSQAALVQIIGLITNSFESITVSLTIFSFFFSYSNVFLTTAKTNYFLLLSRKKLISSKQS
ncbi:MAG: hypothetical protein QW412_01410 [Candidatus Aenigmatarchaeota archaeon]